MLLLIFNQIVGSFKFRLVHPFVLVLFLLVKKKYKFFYTNTFLSPQFKSK